MINNAPKIESLIAEFFTELEKSCKPGRPLPYAEWDKESLEINIGLPLLPLPDHIQHYIDGQDEFTKLEHDAIEAAVERHFDLPVGYAAAFCAFTPVPRDVVFIKWDGQDEAEARKAEL